MQSTWRDCFQSDSWVEAAKILIQSIWWQAWDYVFITNPWLILMQMAQGHDLRNSAVSNRVVGVFLLQKDVPRLSCPHYRKTDISCGQGMFWTMILSSNCMFESIGEVLWKYQYMEYIPKDFDWVGVVLRRDKCSIYLLHHLDQNCISFSIVLFIPTFFKYIFKKKAEYFLNTKNLLIPTEIKSKMKALINHFNKRTFRIENMWHLLVLR